tara:strand:- start:1626 stop:1847 length:222 start_codon:yes stop_codon:yes gene_type:complete
MNKKYRTVDFGFLAATIHEQFPELSEDAANHFEKDSESLSRLRLRDILTAKESAAARKRLLKRISKELAKVQK